MMVTVRQIYKLKMNTELFRRGRIFRGSIREREKIDERAGRNEELEKRGGGV